ncbi:MAG TPA: 4-(cytidine 5'-diphospho)-2-C-methyl-D-erythritol kinase, partial [Pyrinomonadaceae bacterium]|nr:4-(cytidine 5'-diphospho)-2-C-methyl-D-erythritol kinase [Pyrinomonadaceae bacterium]
MIAEFMLPSYAKINLSQRVLGKRDDGFHELCTVFQTVSLHDDISFARQTSSQAAPEVVLTCSDETIPTDGRNLIIKAANAFCKQYQINHGAEIHLEKRIPSPGGLGGGSSNAAVALIGLAKLWNIPVSTDGLMKIARNLGSDVPLFLRGGTALGTGRGEEIESLDDFPAKYLAIITPDIDVPTRPVFEALNAPNLTMPAPESILNVCRFDVKWVDFLQSAMKNDLESVVFTAFPEVERVKQTLLELGAVHAGMSGSGASVFAIFDKEETRQTALKALEIEPSWRKFAVAAISRSEYREAL